MKQKLLMISYLMFNIIFYPLSINANEDNTSLIATYEEDVNGNGLKEIIKLKGILLSEDQEYYHDVWVDITNQFGEKFKISYEGGYNPRIQFVDLNNDGINDIFFQISKDLLNGVNFYRLHTIKDEKVLEINLPHQENVSGEFSDQFKINIRLSSMMNPTVIDVLDRSEHYIKNYLYNKQGNLLKEKSITLNPWVKHAPLLISAKNGYVLKTYQEVIGAFKNDHIGTIETLWYYEDISWTILQTEIVQSSLHSKRK